MVFQMFNLHLFARVSLLDRLTSLALHLTAPDKAAVAPLYASYLFDVEPSSAAQRLATLGPVGRPTAFAAASTGNAAAWIGTAVVGRPVDVDQLGVGDGLATLALFATAQSSGGGCSG